MWAGDIQLVVLAAGRGSRMTELIGNSVPKCLIPVAGNPLIFYPLETLSRNGFAGRDVLVIIQERDDIRKTVIKLGEKVGLNIETFGVPEDSEDFGTAESLRLAISAKKITKDVLVISCDLLGDLPIKEMLQLHGLRESSLTSVYMKSHPLPVTRLPGPKSKVVQERDIVGVRMDTKELVFMASEADLDEELSLPTSTLKKFPNFKLFTWLTDCHLYIIKKKVLDKLFCSLPDDEKVLSLQGEFLPWVIQNEYETQTHNKIHSQNHNEENSSQPEQPKFYCYLELDQEKFCIRINSIHNYMVAIQSADWLKKIYPVHISRPKETKIAKGCKLIAVALGDHCNVGGKCKLTNVISLDHVRIEEGCELQNVIISSNAQIGANSVIKDTIIGPKYQISAGAKHTNEHLTVVEETFFEA